MCLAVPGRIVELIGDDAVVDMQGNQTGVCTALTPEAKADDWVLVHAGFAITKIDEAEARETWAYRNGLTPAELRDAMDEDAESELP